MSLDYSSHVNPQGECCLEIDRRDQMLVLEMWHPSSAVKVPAAFTLEEAEEIAAAIARVCRNIRNAAAMAVN